MIAMLCTYLLEANFAICIGFIQFRRAHRIMTQTTVALCFDFDAVSVWLHTFNAYNSPTKHSRGVFGADVGSSRILDILDKTGVQATWFIPGHTIESFRDKVAEIYSRGYDIQCHGWTHTNPSEFDSKLAEKQDIKQAISSIKDITGKTPSGYRSPYWDFSSNTLEIIQELGFDWSSSQMERQFQPYFIRKGWRAPHDDAYKRGEKTEILEFPVSWYRDDWPAFQYIIDSPSQGPRPCDKDFFEGWKAQFNWMHENIKDGVFTLTMHPQIIGRAPRNIYLEELIDYMKSKDGVRFKSLDNVSDEFYQDLTN